MYLPVTGVIYNGQKQRQRFREVIQTPQEKESLRLLHRQSRASRLQRRVEAQKICIPGALENPPEKNHGKLRETPAYAVGGDKTLAANRADAVYLRLVLNETTTPAEVVVFVLVLHKDNVPFCL